MIAHVAALLLPWGPLGDPACELPAEILTTQLLLGSVAMSGDVAAVAAKPGEMLVYAYADGSWSLDEVVTTVNSPGSLAVSGNTIAVGQPTNDDLGEDNGTVEVFVRDGSGWSREAQLFPDDPEPFDLYGHGVALEGDLLLVGAPGRGLGGGVIVYERSGTTWSQTDELIPDLPAADLEFGGAVSLSNGTALISEFSGDAYAFVDDGAGWSQQAKLTLPVTFPGFTSVAVAVDGDVAVVGHTSFGVLIFERSGTTWAEVGAFPGSVGLSSTVALSGDVAVIEGGGVDVYVRGNGTWSLLTRGDPPFLAGGVAIDGQRVMSAEGAFLNAQLGSVRAYDVPDFFAPEVAYRNAGTNPDSYVASPGYVGGSLDFRVDLSTTGHDMALVIGFDSPFGLTLGGGQTLLCLDLMGSGGELINTGFHPGPMAEIELAVPNDLSFAGFTVCTQAVHAFGVVPFALSNAQDIVIGACFP